MAQVIMDHGVSSCFGIRLAPVLGYCFLGARSFLLPYFLFWPMVMGTISLLRLPKSYSSIAMSAMSCERSSISSTVGALVRGFFSRLGMHSTGLPVSITHRACSRLFLLSVWFSALLRRPITSVLRSFSSSSSSILAFSLMTSCLNGRSFVRISANSSWSPQVVQANSSVTLCSRENLIASLPSALSYRVLRRLGVKTSVTTSL